MATPVRSLRRTRWPMGLRSRSTSRRLVGDVRAPSRAPMSSRLATFPKFDHMTALWVVLPARRIFCSSIIRCSYDLTRPAPRRSISSSSSGVRQREAVTDRQSSRAALRYADNSPLPSLQCVVDIPLKAGRRLTCIACALLAGCAGVHSLSMTLTVISRTP